MTTYEMKQPIVQTKLSVMRFEFKQAFSWIDWIPLEKWTQAYDGGKRYGHLTTNLAECINFMLKGARSLSISALVKATFEKTKTWFVERVFKNRHHVTRMSLLFRRYHNLT